MGHRRCGRGYGGFDGMNGDYGDYRNYGNGCHRGGGSLIGLIFAVISFSITLAFKVAGIVVQAIFGVLSGLLSGSRSGDSTEERAEDQWNEKKAASYTVGNENHGTAGRKTEAKSKSGTDNKDNVRDFRKSEESATTAEHDEKGKSSKSEEVRNKDFYIVLFILTVLPLIVALAMGKLFYAGMIAAGGFGLMILTGIISGIAEGLRKRSEAKKEEIVAEDEPEKDETIEKLIKDAFEKLFEIRKNLDRIKDDGVRTEVEAICATGEKIIGEVRTNPEGLSQVRKFFYYYLDAFGEIVRKYIKLTSFEEASEEVSKLVAETENSFADIDAIFRELCEKLLEKDMMHLKAEINVIKNSN